MKQEDTTRKCIVSGDVLPKEALLRFCVTPENEVVPDFKKRLGGKGIYVLNAKTVLEKAILANTFAKAAKKKVRPAANLAAMVEQILRHSALQAVSLARKAGCFVCGLDKVLEAIKKDKAAFVLEAKDAGNDGHQRILLAAKAIEILQMLETEELDAALNKENTVHVAFLKSEMAKMVNVELRKLSDFLSK